MNFVRIYLGEGRGVFTKIGRDEVLMALLMRWLFQPYPPRGGSRVGRK